MRSFKSSIPLSLAIFIAALCGAFPASAKVLSCLQLKQNCEAYAAHRLNALAHTQADQVGDTSARGLSAGRCQELYSSAAATGIWPENGATPALPCTK
jgi:hypothetical protein